MKKRERDAARRRWREAEGALKKYEEQTKEWKEKELIDPGCFSRETAKEYRDHLCLEKDPGERERLLKEWDEHTHDVQPDYAAESWDLDLQPYNAARARTSTWWPRTRHQPGEEMAGGAARRPLNSCWSD
jgi:hypothetical protein